MTTNKHRRPKILDPNNKANVNKSTRKQLIKQKTFTNRIVSNHQFWNVEVPQILRRWVHPSLWEKDINYPNFISTNYNQTGQTIYPKSQRKQDNLRLGSCWRKHYISGLNCINTHYRYSTVKKKTCTNCLRGSRSRVSSLTAYWEAANPVSRDLWVPAVFIPHQARNT